MLNLNSMGMKDLRMGFVNIVNLLAGNAAYHTLSASQLLSRLEQSLGVAVDIENLILS